MVATTVQADARTHQPVRTDTIAGGFRRITVHQLCTLWWLYSESHITKRQLRVYLAIHEMAERRRHTRDAERPLYRLSEIKALVGGRGSKTATSALKTDVRALNRLGLVKFTKHAITFATSIDQIRLEDVSGFWAFFDQIPNRDRTVPMPRRTLRALAGGFHKAETALILALIIRCLFWHKRAGDYRIDGRAKYSTIAALFGISRRALSDAHARLLELGWLTELDVAQWEKNKWGKRCVINVDWKPVRSEPAAAGGAAAQVEETPAGESATPRADNAGESATPCLNSSPFPSEKDLETRRPAPMRAEPSGVSIETRQGKGSRKKKSVGQGEPKLSDVTAEDLRDTDRLLELYRQAVKRELIPGSEAGQLDFLAFAERARAHGHDAPRLFVWLLKNRRSEFITQADEDAAAERLREHRGEKKRTRASGGGGRGRRSPARRILTDEEKYVEACLRAGRQVRLPPAEIARRAKGWSRQQWERARLAYVTAQARDWHRPELEGAFD